MSLLQPELSSPQRPSTGSKIAGPALLAGAALVLVGAGTTLVQRSEPSVDPCAMPGGTRLADLDSHDASLVTRRLLACSDLRFGRISSDEYRSAISSIDKQWEPPPAPMPSIVWASSVRGFSSQYSPSSWSATQVLGAPNVWPGSGDNANAWASQGADDRDEWLEVGFERAGRISAVEIFETFNPGAIDRVELITATGKTILARLDQLGDIGGLHAPAMKRIATTACTSEPIVAVRVHVGSTRVPGWNEIDAIGVVPCGRQ
jgi:hypothetical protein